MKKEVYYSQRQKPYKLDYTTLVKDFNTLGFDVSCNVSNLEKKQQDNKVKRLVSVKKFFKTEKGKEARRKYQQSEHCKEYQRQYWKAYSQREEFKAKHRERESARRARIKADKEQQLNSLPIAPAQGNL